MQLRFGGDFGEFMGFRATGCDGFRHPATRLLARQDKAPVYGTLSAPFLQPFRKGESSC